MQKLRNDFFYLDIYLLRKINGLVSTTFTLEQKSIFKLERNKDLTFIVIIIDIDWYEKKLSWSFFWPYRPALHKPLRKCNAPFHNRKLQLSKLKTVNNVLSFTISSSPKEEQSLVTDTRRVSITDLRKNLAIFINVDKKVLRNDAVSINRCYATKTFFFFSRDKSWQWNLTGFWRILAIFNGRRRVHVSLQTQRRELLQKRARRGSYKQA